MADVTATPTSRGPSNKGLAVVVGLALVGGATGVYWRTRLPAAMAVSAAAGSHAAAAESTGSGELTALRSEVLRLRERLASEEQARASGAPASADNPQDSAQHTAAPPTPEQEAAWLSARSAFYDEFFEQETRDEAWASRMEATAREVTKKQNQTLGVELASVRCWSSVCRMEFSYRDQSIRMKHIYTLGREYQELPAVSYSYPGEPRDHTRLVAYMAVDSESFPQFDYAHFTDSNRQSQN